MAVLLALWFGSLMELNANSRVFGYLVRCPVSSLGLELKQAPQEVKGQGCLLVIKKKFVFAELQVIGLVVNQHKQQVKVNLGLSSGCQRSENPREVLLHSKARF